VPLLGAGLLVVGLVLAVSYTHTAGLPQDATPTIAVPHGRVAIAKVTLSANHQKGRSAVSLQLANGTDGQIAVTSVSATVATAAMLHFDADMCQNNSTMTPLREIDVAAGHVQVLGYRNQGAMLGGLRQTLLPGQHVEVTVAWRDARGARQSQTVTALVVKPPANLHLGSSGMPGMPGM
jgi:copper(I)-binding protein